MIHFYLVRNLICALEAGIGNDRKGLLLSLRHFQGAFYLYGRLRARISGDFCERRYNDQEKVSSKKRDMESS